MDFRAQNVSQMNGHTPGYKEIFQTIHFIIINIYFSVHETDQSI